MTTTKRSPARLVRFDELDFVPRFEYGEMAQFAEVSGAGDGTELGVGFARMTGAKIPWTIRYDEVLIVLSGRLTVHIGDAAISAGPRDSIWLPKDTALTYDAEDALVAYAIHPVDWAARQESDD
jgi:ethanolamine utilization protein EutQ